MATLKRQLVEQQKLKEQVHGQMLSSASRRQAKALENEERERRVAEERYLDVLQEAVRIANCRDADQAVEEERRRRVSDPDANRFRPLEVEQHLKQVHEQLLVAYNTKLAIHATMCEQAARINKLRYDMVLRHLETAAAREQARHAEQAEQQRRVAEAAPTVGHNNVLHAILAQFMERVFELQLQQARNKSDAHAYYDNVMQRVFEELQHSTHAKEVDQAADLEQHQRIAQGQMQHVLTDLERAVAARDADQAAEHERAERIHYDLMTHLHEDLERRSAAQTAQAAAAVGRAEALTDDHIEAAVNHFDADAMRELMVDIERLVHTRQVCRAMDDERAQRSALEYLRAEVLPQLRRSSAAKTANAASDLEQAQRVQQAQLTNVVLPQLQSTLRARETRSAMELERAERMHHDVFGQVLDQLERHCIAVAVDRAMETERAEQMADNVHQAYQADVLRQLHAHFADLAALEEQARRQAPENLATTAEVIGQLDDLHAELLSRASQAEARERSRMEQDEQMAASHMREQVLPALLSFHNRRDTRQAEQAEQAQRMARSNMNLVLGQLTNQAVVQHLRTLVEEERAAQVSQQTYDQVMDELQRATNAAQADQAMDEERVRRTQEYLFAAGVQEGIWQAGTRRMYEDLCQQPVHDTPPTASHRHALSATLEQLTTTMQARESEAVARAAATEAVARHQFVDVLEQLRAQAACRDVARAVQEHIQMSKQRGNMHQVLHQLRNNYVRGMLRAECEAERGRRVQEEFHRNCMGQLEQQYAAHTADLLAEAEREERMRVEHDQDLLAAKERHVARHFADIAIDEERRRQVEEGDTHAADRFAPAQVHLREAVVARAHAREVDRAAEAERQERMVVDRMAPVLDDVVRAARARQADELAADAHAAAMHEHRYGPVLRAIESTINRRLATRAAAQELQAAKARRIMDQVCEQLRASGARAEAALLEEQERLARISAPRQPGQEMLQVQEEAAAHARRRQLDEIENQERAERVHHERMQGVCADVAHHRAKQEVIAAEEEERSRRITEEHHALVMQAMLSHFNRIASNELEQAERLRRLAVPPTPTHGELVARDRVLDQLLRTVYGAQIANQVAEEQRDATLRHCYTQVLDQIARGASHVAGPRDTAARRKFWNDEMPILSFNKSQREAHSAAMVQLVSTQH